MATPTVNLRDLVVLIADPSSYLSMLVHGILRGFPINVVLIGLLWAVCRPRIFLGV